MSTYLRKKILMFTSVLVSVKYNLVPWVFHKPYSLSTRSKHVKTVVFPYALILRTHLHARTRVHTWCMEKLYIYVILEYFISRVSEM